MVSDIFTRRLLLHKWRKEGNNLTRQSPNFWCSRDAYCKTLYLSPCLNVDWQVGVQVETSGFLPYNLYDPIPIRNHVNFAYAFKQHQEDQDFRPSNSIENKQDELRMALFNCMQFRLLTDIIQIILMYITSILVSEVQAVTPQTPDPLILYPHYGMITCINQLTGPTLRHIDIHKIHHPNDVVSQIVWDADLISLSSRRKLHQKPSLLPYTFVLDIKVAVPTVAITHYKEWPLDFTLEEWILWDFMKELATRNQRDWMLSNGVLYNTEWKDTLMLFHMDKRNPDFFYNFVWIYSKGSFIIYNNYHLMKFSR